MGIAEVIRYAISQVIWLVVEAVELVSAMGIGLRWIFMTFRCIAFALLDLVFFVPNLVWYIFSPNIIRRVSYRASTKTKKKNFKKLVKLLQKVDISHNKATSFPPRSAVGTASGTGSLPSFAASPDLRSIATKRRSLTPSSFAYSSAGGNAEASPLVLDNAAGVSAFFSTSTRFPFGSSQPTPTASLYGSPLQSLASQVEERRTAEADTFSGPAVDAKRSALRGTKATHRLSLPNGYPIDDSLSPTSHFHNFTPPMVANKEDQNDDMVDNHWMEDGTNDGEINVSVPNSRSLSVPQNVWQLDEDELAEDAEMLNRTVKLSEKIFKTRDSLDEALEMLQHSFQYKALSTPQTPLRRGPSSSSSGELPVEPFQRQSSEQKGLEEVEEQQRLPSPLFCRTETREDFSPVTAVILPEEAVTLEGVGECFPPPMHSSSLDHPSGWSTASGESCDGADGGDSAIYSSLLDRAIIPDVKTVSPAAGDRSMPMDFTSASTTLPPSTQRHTDRNVEPQRDATLVKEEWKQGRESDVGNTEVPSDTEAKWREEAEENVENPTLSSSAFSKRPTPIQGIRKTPVTRFISKMKSSLRRFSPLHPHTDNVAVTKERSEACRRDASPSPSLPSKDDRTPTRVSRSASQTSDFVHAVSESWKTYKWKHGESGDSSDSESSEEDNEDAHNLHNRANLDIYLPVSVDSLFRAMNEEHRRRAEGDVTFKVKKFPIVIAVNGGAWIVGCYIWNFLIARVLASRGYVVFCPDYRNFPQATMEGMTLDVSDAIAWVLRNAERYNGDLEDVTLLGQSAGAHLTMMSLLSQAQWFGFKANVGKPSSLSPPSSVAYNVPRYNPRASIRLYIGLSGIYNVKHLVKHLNKRGLYRHVLHKIAGGKENMPRYSLNSYFDPCRQGDTGEVLPDNIFDFLPPKMYFLHGDADCSAPVTESSSLVSMMRMAQEDLRAKKKALQLSSVPVNPPAVPCREECSSKKQGDELQRRGASCSSTVSVSVPPVDIKFILFPGVNHTDSIIEEPLAVGNSHVAEFLQHERGSSKGKEWPVAESPLPVTPPAAGNVSSTVPSPGEASGRHVSFGLTPGASAAQRCPCSFTDPAPPDMILPSVAPPSARPFFLRAGSMVCPF